MYPPKEPVMPTFIDRDEVSRLQSAGAQLVEVLPPSMYDHEHLPGARNIPLKRIDRDAGEQLDAQQPVIVYCSSFV